MKEAEAFRVMELSGQSLITHDDRLLIRAQKSEIGLEADWRNQVDVTYDAGWPVIVDYWRTGESGEAERVSSDEYEGLGILEQATYRPQYERGLKLAEGVTVSLKNNQMDLRLCNLFEDWRSRYRLALENMVTLTERGVIMYRARAEDGGGKNRQEAIRNRLKRWGRPTEYEHNVLFYGELGKRIHADLKDKAKNSRGETLYIQGYNRTVDTEKAVKYYDIGDREGKGAGVCYKLETTMCKEYFKKNKITVEALTEQPKIQGTLNDALADTVARVLNLLSREVLEMVADSVDMQVTDRRKAPARIARAILSTDRTLTERVRELERVQAEHARRIAALERERKD